MRTTNLQHADPARAGSDPDDDEDLANVDTLAFGEAFLRAVVFFGWIAIGVLALGGWLA